MNILERLESRSMPLPWSGCVIWLGPAHRIGKYGRGGYGIFATDGRHVYVHRLAYELLHGPIPAGMMVCHSCDVRCCINPAHLFLSNAKGNHDDKVRKGRQRSPGAPGDLNGVRKNPELVRGENNGRAVLTWATVRKIREAYAAGIEHKSLAEQYGVGKSQIGRVCRNEEWKVRDGG